MVNIQAEVENYIVDKKVKEVTPPYGQYFPVPGKYTVAELSLAACLRNLIWRRQVIMNELEQKYGDKLREFIGGEKILSRRERMSIPIEFPQTIRDLYKSEISLMREREVNHITIRYFAELVQKQITKDLTNGKIPYFNFVEITQYEFIPPQSKEARITLTTPLGISTIEEEYIQFFAVKSPAFTGWAEKIGTKTEPYPFHKEIANASASIHKMKRYRIVYIDEGSYKIAEHYFNTDPERLFNEIKNRAWYVYWSEYHGQFHRQIKLMKPEEWQCAKCPFAIACPANVQPEIKPPTEVPPEFFGRTEQELIYDYSKFYMVDTGGLGL